ncbi:MAG: response regulator [Deltaproteobacteria bacterium]|nr:MAG: response regulator [Deltaproteobacteria bacterium]
MRWTRTVASKCRVWGRAPDSSRTPLTAPPCWITICQEVALRSLPAEFDVPPASLTSMLPHLASLTGARASLWAQRERGWVYRAGRPGGVESQVVRAGVDRGLPACVGEVLVLRAFEGYVLALEYDDPQAAERALSRTGDAIVEVLRACEASAGAKELTVASRPTYVDQRRLLEIERALLSQLVAGEPDTRVLEQLVLGVEATITGAIGSVLLIDPDQPDRLCLGSSPNLPSPLARCSDGLPVGPDVGTCGRAAYFKRPIYTSDVRVDPAWEGFAHVPVEVGLVSCWSVPILSRGGEVLGTFAIYLPTPGEPAEDLRELLHSFAQIAALALELRRAREALEHREVLFEAAARATSQAIWDLDFATRTLRWHAGENDPFGLGASSKEGLETWASLIHPDDRAAVVESLDQAVDRGDETWAASYRFRRSDGSYTWVLDRGLTIFDVSGTPLRMIGGLSDDGARRQSEQRLREQAEVLDQVQSAIIVIDLEGVVTVWNRAAERLYGVPSRQAEGADYRSTGVALDMPFDELCEVLATEGRRSASVRLERADGEVRELRSMWRVVRDNAGLPRSLVLVQTDETGRLRMERQQLRAQRLESIGTLAGGVAHDLNNMLTPILASVDLVRLKVSDPSALENLQIMEDAAERGATMVQQLLQFARGAEAERGPVDLVLLMSEVRRIIRDTLPRSVRLHVEVEADLPTVQGDTTQLHQVLLNLVINARDAMPEGGDLTLVATTVEILPEHLPHLASVEARAGRYVKLSVGDTGTGIPPEVKERIFEPFFTTKGVGSGTGLGLSTVLALVRAHKGFIELSTAPNEGTRVCVFLPVSVADCAVDGPCSGREVEPSGQGQRILVVDDEPAVRTIATRLLEGGGYQVAVAGDGEAALRAIEREHGAFDCVVTDLMMPQLDGYELIRRVRDRYPAVPMVAMTGLDRGDAREHVLASGASALLPKPFTGHSLLRVVGEAIAANHEKLR